MKRMHASAAFLILFGACLCQSAAAQSDSDLRRENQRLQTENEDLRREMEAARLRIAELEREVALLRRQVEEARRGTARPDDAPVEPPLGPGSVDESQPSASPRALLNALIASYEETLGEKEIGEARSREREQFVRAVQQWRERMHREYRRLAIDWHVRVIEAAPATAPAAGYVLRLVVIDPMNGAELGSPFTVQLPRTLSRRYEQIAARGEVGLFVLRGWITPAININESRLAAGPFNNPPFIGTFAEYGFTIDPRSFLPAGEEER